MKEKIKKNVINVILIIVISIGSISCAKTPEKAIVTDKSAGLPKDCIIPVDNKKPKTLGIPEHWKETIEKSDKYVTLEADCDMEIPEIYSTPVYSYEMKLMSKEFLEKLCDYFSEGDKLYEYPRMTQDELQAEKEKIINYKGRWGTWKDLSGTSYWKNRLAKLDEMIGNAPEKQTEHQYINAKFMRPYETEKDYFNEVSDYYYKTKDNIGFIARVDKGEEVDPVIRAVNYNNKIGSTTKFQFQQGTYLDEIEMEQLTNNNMESTEEYDKWLNELKKEISDDAELSKEEALKIVDKVLKDLSIEGFEVKDCVKVIGSEKSESWALLEDIQLEKNIGYSVYLYRKVGDVIGYDQWSPLIYDDLPETIYAPAFATEKIHMTITKEGIREFKWTNISNKVDTIAENTKLLLFEEVKDNLSEHLLYGALSDEHEGLKGEGTRFVYKVKDVQLRSANINAYENPDTVWMVPVWVFDLERTGILETGEELKWGIETVVLNAIDGGYVTIQN